MGLIRARLIFPVTILDGTEVDEFVLLKIDITGWIAWSRMTFFNTRLQFPHDTNHQILSLSHFSAKQTTKSNRASCYIEFNTTVMAGTEKPEWSHRWISHISYARQSNRRWNSEKLIDYRRTLHHIRAAQSKWRSFLLNFQACMFYYNYLSYCVGELFEWNSNVACTFILNPIGRTYTTSTHNAWTSPVLLWTNKLKLKHYKFC